MKVQTNITEQTKLSFFVDQFVVDDATTIVIIVVVVVVVTVLIM